jgi:TonB family protein
MHALIFFALLASGDVQDASARPKPIDPANWVRSDDYPVEALRAKEHGVVEFELGVSESGGVERCTITRTSGSARLDAASCAIITQRARFEPAHNAAGLATPSTFKSRFRWDLPEVVADGTVPAGPGTFQPLISWRIVTQLDVGADGKMVNCRSDMEQPDPRYPSGGAVSCGRYRGRDLSSYSQGKPVQIILVEEQLVEGQALSPAREYPDYATSYVWSLRLQVDAEGRASGCVLTNQIGNMTPGIDMCAPGGVPWSKPPKAPVFVVISDKLLFKR